MQTKAKSKKGKSASGSAMNPLPSLIRASAFDAANLPCFQAGRKKWSRADYNRAAETQERLIRACYSKAGEGPESRTCFIRFGLAEYLERNGGFTLRCDFSKVFAHICAYLEQPIVAEAA